MESRKFDAAEKNAADVIIALRQLRVHIAIGPVLMKIRR